MGKSCKKDCPECILQEPGSERDVLADRSACGLCLAEGRLEQFTDQNAQAGPAGANPDGA